MPYSIRYGLNYQEERLNGANKLHFFRRFHLRLFFFCFRFSASIWIEPESDLRWAAFLCRRNHNFFRLILLRMRNSNNREKPTEDRCFSLLKDEHFKKTLRQPHFISFCSISFFSCAFHIITWAIYETRYLTHTHIQFGKDVELALKCVFPSSFGIHVQKRKFH